MTPSAQWFAQDLVHRLDKFDRSEPIPALSAAHRAKARAFSTRLVTPPGGRVLDPFNGSGSTGKACVLEGFRYTGIDLDESGVYLPISLARILYALKHRDRWEKIHAAPSPVDDTPGQSLMILE